MSNTKLVFIVIACICIGMSAIFNPFIGILAGFFGPFLGAMIAIMK